MLLLLVFGYLVAALLAWIARGHARRFECIGCRNRRRMVRLAVVAAVVIALLLEHDPAPADFGFVLLAVLVEVS